MAETTPPPAYQKPDLQRTYLIPSEFDFELYTDGSGHTDLFGGAAVYGVSIKYSKVFQRAAAFYGADTERAEFEALLMGLQGILDVMKWDGKLWQELMRDKRCRVFWVSDRESLVGCVALDPKGFPYYRRRTCLDLWARFDYYNKLFDVQAVHRKRNSHPYQAIADEVSSECRALIKQYWEVRSADSKVVI